MSALVDTAWASCSAWRELTKTVMSPRLRAALLGAVVVVVPPVLADCVDEVDDDVLAVVPTATTLSPGSRKAVTLAWLSPLTDGSVLSLTLCTSTVTITLMLSPGWIMFATPCAGSTWNDIAIWSLG